MNLGKLLGTGKSFISGGKPASYREDKRFYLPQFVSPKNPFANTAPPGAPAEGVRSSPPVASPRPFAAPAPGPAGATARSTNWVSRLNPAAIFSQSTAAAKSHLTPVQTELSLEKVKVVQNDLTDAEVEVVPLKSRPGPVAEPPAAGKSWADLGERIMKATAL